MFTTTTTTKGLSMAEEIEIAPKEEQELLQGENLEQSQPESEEQTEGSENVEAQEGEQKKDKEGEQKGDKKPNQGMLERINKLTRRVYEKDAEITKRDALFIEQERLLEASLQRIKELEGVEDSSLSDNEKIALNVEKSILEKQTNAQKTTLEKDKVTHVIEKFNAGVQVFETEFSDYRKEAEKVESALDRDSIKYLLDQGASEDLVGQKIVYYLGKNEKELNLFKKLDPTERKQELFELKKKVLKGELEFPEVQPQKQQIKATPKIGGASSASVDYTKLSPFSPEYEAYRKSLGFK